MNLNTQYYKEIPLRQIKRKDYRTKRARRFVINDTNQNVWIPNRYLEQDGTIKNGVNIDFVFKNSKRKFELAGLPMLNDQFKKE